MKKAHLSSTIVVIGLAFGCCAYACNSDDSGDGEPSGTAGTAGSAGSGSLGGSSGSSGAAGAAGNPGTGGTTGSGGAGGSDTMKPDGGTVVCTRIADTNLDGVFAEPAAVTYAQFDHERAVFVYGKGFDIAYEYDDAGRIARSVKHGGRDTYTTRYEYQDGKLTLMVTFIQYTSSVVDNDTRYTYDEQGRLLKSEITLRNGTFGSSVTYEYGTNGRPARSTFKNAQGTALYTYSYNAAGQLIHQHSPFTDLYLTYDAEGRLTNSSSSSSSKTSVSTWTYEGSDRATSERDNDGDGEVDFRTLEVGALCPTTNPRFEDPTPRVQF